MLILRILGLMEEKELNYIFILTEIQVNGEQQHNTPNILTTSLHNSDTSWNYGAFISTQSNDMFDYGWGVYNIQTHNIVGDSLFIIKTINGNWKKLFIKRKTSGEYFLNFLT